MTKIHTETFGQGKPIVLLHGWAMHSGILRVFANELANNFQVTLVDLPGHGRSQAISPFTLDTVIPALVEAMTETDEPSCWLGWSLGATFVLEIAQHYPKKVNRLILLAGTPCFVKRDSWSGLDEQVLENFATSLQQDTQGTLLRFLALQIKGLDDQKLALQKIIPLVSEYPAPDQPTLQDGLDILKHTDLREGFARLNIPVSVILGKLDTLVPAVSGEQMQALLPTVDLHLIASAGHVPFLSHQHAVVKAVCDFMDKH
jgi:pimeloyl-[acyl-carrier protein] methyl ester esterase